MFKMIWGLVKHFFDPELRDLIQFANDTDADSQRLLDKYIDRDVLPHVIHPGGKDGRVARGYEHVIMEGGLIPEEGTYKTPEYVKQGRTRAEEEALQREADITQVTSNLQEETATPVVNPTNCQVILKGSYEMVMVAQEWRALVNFDRDSKLMGLN